jgi:hypothetical protein
LFILPCSWRWLKICIREKNEKGKDKKGKGFNLHHCWAELEHDEKWKNRESELPNNKRKNKSSIGDETIVECDGASSGEESPTPNSIAKTKRPDGRKFAKEIMKGKKSGDDDIQKSLDVLMNARKQMEERSKGGDTSQTYL